MKLDTIHHIAIIGHDYAKTREFYVDKLGFEQLDEHQTSRIFSLMSAREI